MTVMITNDKFKVPESDPKELMKEFPGMFEIKKTYQMPTDPWFLEVLELRLEQVWDKGNYGGGLLKKGDIWLGQ